MKIPTLSTARPAVTAACAAAPAALRRALAAAADRIARGHKARRDGEHLNGLPDHLLDDVGLTRADVAARVFGLGARRGGIGRRP